MEDVYNLKFVQCTNDDCSTNNATTVDSGWVFNSSLAIAYDGFARISYTYLDFEDETNDLKFVQCTNDDCSTNNATTVDSTSDVGQYTSLAISPDDGFARISYYDNETNELKFVQCTNDDCSTKNITTVDSAGDVRGYLALGSDGFARISYTYYNATRKTTSSNSSSAPMMTVQPKTSPPLTQQVDLTPPSL